MIGDALYAHCFPVPPYQEFCVEEKPFLRTHLSVFLYKRLEHDRQRSVRSDVCGDREGSGNVTILEAAYEGLTRLPGTDWRP